MGSSSSSSESSSTNEISLSDLRSFYNKARGNNAYLVDLVNILDLIIARDSAEDSETSTITTDIDALYRLISINTKEILYLHRLLALLIFELAEQGIEVESKELLTELKIYLDKNVS